MMSFKDIKLNTEYRSGKSDVIKDFYIPVLSRAVKYKRAVGFFSSTALIQIAKGISEMVVNGGHIQLIASPRLSEEDILAIQKGYESREQVVTNAIMREFKEPTSYFESERLNMLATLIAVGKLDIKIAFTHGRNQLGIYHEKMGLVYDSDNNVIAFSGSTNESETAFVDNYEVMDVYCSWQSSFEEKKVAQKELAFHNFKKGPLTFMILSLLYPDLKLSEIKWHQDHIHPRYAFEKNRLIKYFAEKGLKLDDITLKEWAAKSNTLVNLQLLTGKQNQEKSKTPLVTWIYNQFPDDDKRKKYCEEHYIDFYAGFELENFDAYYNRRREKLKKKLMEIFSVQVISEEETRIIEEQTSEEESVITPEGKTIAEAAVSVLIDHPEGLTCKQIYEAIMEQHLYEFKAEKPEVVLRIEIRRRCQNVDISKSYETKWFRIIKEVDGECYYGITFSD